TAATYAYTLSLHDALPILGRQPDRRSAGGLSRTGARPIRAWRLEVRLDPPAPARRDRHATRRSPSPHPRRHPVAVTTSTRLAVLGAVVAIGAVAAYALLIRIAIVRNHPEGYVIAAALGTALAALAVAR